MYRDNVLVVERFLDELMTGGDFAGVAMRDDLRSVGPLCGSANADEYRALCREFSESVKGVSVKTLVGDDDVIHTVYDVDMGLPDGPLLTSQTVEFVDGAFASVEVIFDAAAITGVES